MRVIDSFSSGDRQIAFIRDGGVTTSLVLPGSGNVMGGEAFLAKHRCKLKALNLYPFRSSSISVSYTSFHLFVLLLCSFISLFTCSFYPFSLLPTMARDGVTPSDLMFENAPRALKVLLTYSLCFHYFRVMAIIFIDIEREIYFSMEPLFVDSSFNSIILTCL